MIRLILIWFVVAVLWIVIVAVVMMGTRVVFG